MKKKCNCGGLQAYAEGGRTRVPTRSTRFIDPEAERIRGRGALAALQGYFGGDRPSAMYPGAQEAYESGELAGMAEMLIPGAAMAKGALGAALAGVIKPRGGNWLTGSVENALKPLSRREFGPESVQQQRDALEFARNRGYSEEMIRELEQAVRQREAPLALNQWIKGPLTKYVKRDMATPEDPIRKLAEQGTLHDPTIADLWGPSILPAVRERRASLGYPEEGLGVSEMARAWEQVSDAMLRGERAKTHQGKKRAFEGDWVDRLDPQTPIYRSKDSAMTTNLGFNHLVDELNNALNPESGLPRNLLLRPEQLQQMGMEKAVRHVDAINKWRESQRAAANAELANKALAIREYPENNPKGLRWVELSKDSPDLEKQLKYEGDVMGHCVGGYCEDVLSGDSRIFSLRDAKGEPHVTIEVAPPGRGPSSWIPEDEEHPVMWPDIIQIKGKGNSAPKDEYLPFVQDFVRNSPLGGTWGDVGDLGNARLHRLEDESGIKYLTPEEYSLPRKKEGGLVTQPDYFDDLDAFLRR